MATSLLDGSTTLPEALMAFLHNDDGQVRQSVRPKQLTAAAELGELILSGHVEVDADNTLTVGRRPGADARPWIAAAVASLANDGTRIDAWLRSRRDAVSTQQHEAVERGILTRDRAKLAGLVPYRRHMVAPQVRDELLAELDAPDAAKSSRARALAKLLGTPAVRRALRFNEDRVERLAALAEDATDTPLPGPLFSTMDYAIASGVALVVLGD